MSTIFYGGTKKQVKKQLKCEHDWHSTGIDEISRFYKCKRCFCMDRDCTKDEYYAVLEERQSLRLGRKVGMCEV